MSRDRMLVILTCACFVASSTILAIATTSPEKVREWPFLGPVDVALVVALLGLMIVLHRAAGPGGVRRELPAAFVAMTVLLPLLFFGLWLAQHSIDWNVLLPGLAWRSFVFVHTLPAALAVWREAVSAAV